MVEDLRVKIERLRVFSSKFRFDFFRLAITKAGERTLSRHFGSLDEAGTYLNGAAEAMTTFSGLAIPSRERVAHASATPAQTFAPFFPAFDDHFAMLVDENGEQPFPFLPTTVMGRMGNGDSIGLMLWPANDAERTVKVYPLENWDACSPELRKQIRVRLMSAHHLTIAD